MTTLVPPSPPRRPERLFTVQEYLRMVEVGILTEKDNVELLNGRIVEKMARNPPHDSALFRLMHALMRALPEGYLVRSQSALQLPSSASVPEPDLAVVRGPASRYDAAHPGPSDVVLVVEISDSTLSDDQGEKLRSYARGGVPLYWIVNLLDRRLERYADPTGPAQFPTYQSHQDFAETQSVSLPLPNHPAITLLIADMLPKPKP